MTWEYLIGSEKDFEGAPDWCTHVSKWSDGDDLCWEMDSRSKRGNKFQWAGDGFECNTYGNPSGIKLNIIAQRRKRESTEWNGEGLPPVGCVCEAYIPCRGEALSKWRRVKVIFHGDEFGATGELIVVDLESTVPYWTDEFRKLKTEHEIKVDGVKRDLLNIISQIGNQFGDVNLSDLGVEAISHELIMLGYEKTK